LTLTAREFVRVAHEVVGIEFDELHQPAYLGWPLLVEEAMNAQWLRDALTDRHTRIERGRWILKDNLHPPTKCAQLSLLEAEDVATADAYMARSWPRQS
jgi:hypothetical protein